MTNWLLKANINKAPHSDIFDKKSYTVHSLDYLFKLSGAGHQAAASALMRGNKQRSFVSECQSDV